MATVKANTPGISFNQGEEGRVLTVPHIATAFSETGLARIDEALNATDMPDMGDPAEGFSSLAVSAITLKVADSAHMVFDVIYTGREGIDNDFGFGTGSGDSITIGASLIAEQINTLPTFDATLGGIGLGTVGISVTYTDPETEVEKEQGGFITKLNPQMTTTLARQTSVSPQSDAQQYVGRVNASVWLDGAIGQWLCMAIIGRSSGWGQVWAVQYTFQFNEAGWLDQRLVYIDPNTGRPPEDVTTSNGIAIIEDIYGAIDFNALQLLPI